MIALLVSLLLPYLPPGVHPTPAGIVVTGQRDCIPLPTEYRFQWETERGNSSLVARRQNGCLVLDWKLDRRGPSWLHMRLIQHCTGAVGIVTWVEYPQTLAERTVNGETYRDWPDLMKHAKGNPLANDLMMVLARSGALVN